MKSISTTKGGGTAGRGVAVLPGDCASSAASFAASKSTRAINGMTADIMSVGGGVAFLDDDWIDTTKQAHDDGKKKNITTQNDNVADAVKDGQSSGATTTAFNGVARDNGSFHAPRLMATRRGILHPPTSACAAWVETSSRRYSPAPGENVIGVVIERHAEHFAVDIGAPSPAILPMLAFEGATRRNKPSLSPGSLVYARTVDACRDMEPELSCTDEDGRAAGFGELDGGGDGEHGYVMHVSTRAARTLLANASGSSQLARSLARAGDASPFEMVVGINGRVWLSARRAADTLRVASAVAEAIRHV